MGALALGASLGLTPSFAQTQSPEQNPLNHAYAVYLGSGYYVSSGRSVFVIRAWPKFRVRSEEEHAFGIRLRVNATLGFYDLKLSDFGEFEVPTSVGTFAVMPGIEFPVKVRPNWTLMPFVDFGVATDTSFDEISLVYGTGLRSRAQFDEPRTKYLFVLWNEFIAAGNSSTDVSRQNSYTVLRTDLEMRGLLRYRLFGRAFDFGPLVGADLYGHGPLIEPSYSDRAEEATVRFEAGFVTGPTERWKVLKNLLPVPRLGLTYRWGDGVRGIRFVIRLRY